MLSMAIDPEYMKGVLAVALISGGGSNQKVEIVLMQPELREKLAGADKAGNTQLEIDGYGGKRYLIQRFWILHANGVLIEDGVLTYADEPFRFFVGSSTTYTENVKGLEGDGLLIIWSESPSPPETQKRLLGFAKVMLGLRLVFC